MSNSVKTVKLPADSELATILKDAVREGVPVIVDTGEVAYSLLIGAVVSRTATPSAETIERSEEGIRQATGRWKDVVDADAFKSYLRERRRTSSRPSVRL